MQQRISRYPRSGRIALLCEGDLIGYEADLLEQWTARRSSFLVDVWPCGTKTAIFGLSDAIGREIPIAVIEDRDHRTAAAAEKECRGMLKNRRKRGVDIRFWRTWQRNEIENYLIEPVVACPVLAGVFRVEQSVVRELLQEIITHTAVDQALQHTLAEFMDAFPKGEKEVANVPRKEGRPGFADGHLRCPDTDKVGTLLGNVLEEAVKKLDLDKRPDCQAFKDRFFAKCEEWKDMDIGDMRWRTDWAGKEVLSWLRICLSGRHGWPGEDGAISPILWDALSREEAGETDRAIEKTIQPRLVKELLRRISESDPSIQEVTDEWEAIAHNIQAA